MIDIKSTIYKSITNKIQLMKCHAVNPALAFRKYLYLIILDDVYEWSKYISDCDQILPKLKLLRVDFVLKNPEFNILYIKNDNFYTNVNTPQTINTWKRLIDNPETIIIDSSEELPVSIGQKPNEKPTGINCQTEIIILPTNNIVIENNKPHVKNWNILSACDMQNYYIDPATGYEWYLDDNCNWLKVNRDYVSADTLDDQIKNVISKYKIKHTNDNNGFKSLLDENLDTGVKVLTTEEIEWM